MKLWAYKDNFYLLKKKQKSLLLKGALHEKQAIMLLIKHLITHEKKKLLFYK